MSFCNTRIWDRTGLWDVRCEAGVVAEIAEASGRSGYDCNGGLLLPRLCHPHIHLDKAYLNDRVDYVTGSFEEALELTAQVKAKMTLEDVMARGRRLIEASLAAGVTLMRAFVEVDLTVRHMCLDAGLALRKEFAGRCDVQIAVFAQDPIFKSSNPAEMKRLLREAAGRVDTIGSAPYVDHVRENIEYISQLATEFGLKLDFHLDYDLGKEDAQIWTLLEVVQHATLGHCTKYTEYDESFWAKLPPTLSIVALPPSDLYMLGRTLARLDQTNFALGVNNLQNPFTPTGDGDPLLLWPMMLTHCQLAPTDAVVRRMVELVSTSAAAAIGVNSSLRVGSEANMTLLAAPNLQSAVCAPPFDRVVVYRGRIVASRTSTVRVCGPEVLE